LIFFFTIFFVTADLFRKYYLLATLFVLVYASNFRTQRRHNVASPSSQAQTQHHNRSSISTTTTTTPSATDANATYFVDIYFLFLSDKAAGVYDTPKAPGFSEPKKQ